MRQQISSENCESIPPVQYLAQADSGGIVVLAETAFRKNQSVVYLEA
jgi:hypothetical protein